MTEKNKISIRMLAEELNLSPTTVSLVLSGKADDLRISPETQLIVRKKAEEIGYSPRSQHPTSRKASKIGNIPKFCVLFPIFNQKNVVEDAAGIQRIYKTFLTLQQSSTLNFDFVIKPYFSEKISDIMQFISGESYDGLFFTGLCDADLAYLEQQDLNVPIVLFNRNSNKFNSVGVDEYMSGQIAAEHFYKKGLRSVGIVLPDLVSQNYSLKKSGFIDYYLKQGIPRQNIYTGYGSRNRDGGICAMRKILQNSPYPSAVFCIDDVMITGIYYAISEANLSIPKDIEIIASGNHEWTANLIPSVTSIAPPIKECVLDCVTLLLKAFEEKDKQKKEPLLHSQYQHTVHLVYRESSPAIK